MLGLQVIKTVKHSMLSYSISSATLCGCLQITRCGMTTVFCAVAQERTASHQHSPHNTSRSKSIAINMIRVFRQCDNGPRGPYGVRPLTKSKKSYMTRPFKACCQPQLKTSIGPDGKIRRIRNASGIVRSGFIEPIQFFDRNVAQKIFLFHPTRVTWCNAI